MFNFVISKINHLAKTANHELCRPLRGLGHPWAFDPGAYAPGFMPSRAPRALLVLTNIYTRVIRSSKGNT
ncbi:MAG TPA: hypothetical protein DC054_11235 [Blastocatellia bacterium]|nr:hypothetical protein [Blastocatellia bacterium]